jgi:hypothetical protein
VDDINVIALSGMMGSGKDTAALFLSRLMPIKQMSYAGPLKQMASLTASATKGDKAALHNLYALLLDVFGGPVSAPSFMEIAVIMNDILDCAEKTDLVKLMDAGAKPRKFLQYVGTNIVRETRENAWADYLNTSILRDVSKAIEDYRWECDTVADHPEKVKMPPMTYVITDMRFPNEIDTIRKLPEMVSGKLNIPCHVWCVKLAISEEDCIQRVAARDSLDPEVVRASLSHASEQKLDEDLFDVIIDATLQPSVIADKLMRISSGSFVKGEGVEKDVVPTKKVDHPTMGKVIDLSALRQ